MTDDMREALLRDLKDIFDVGDPVELGTIVLSASEQIYKAGARWQSRQAQGDAVLEVTGRSDFPGYVIAAEINGHGATLGQQYCAAPRAPAAVPELHNKNDPLPCPFCGNSDVEAPGGLDHDGTLGGFLCGCSLEPAVFFTAGDAEDRDRALSAWNTRGGRTS